MQPDYFAILRTLYELRIAKQIGAKANSLLLALVWKANVLHFPGSLAVWNSELRDIAGLSEDELVAARNRLTQVQINEQHIVKYQSGGTRSPGRYTLNYTGLMSFFNDVTSNITPENPVNVQGNVRGNLQGNVPGNVGDHSIPTKETNNSTTDRHKKTPTRIFTRDSIEFQLSVYLLQNIKKHLPNVKEPNLQSWAGQMDLLLRIDKRDPAEIKAVIDFAQNDTFWQSNILSVNKLRSKYDQLNSKRLSCTPSKKTGDGCSVPLFRD